MCRRPSGHKAADFHARRKAEAEEAERRRKAAEQKAKDDAEAVARKEQERIEREAYEKRLAEMRAATRASLIEHFRSQPEIVALASCFSGYSLDVRTAPRSLGTVSRRLREAVTVYDVAGASERAIGPAPGGPDQTCLRQSSSWTTPISGSVLPV